MVYMCPNILFHEGRQSSNGSDSIETANICVCFWCVFKYVTTITNKNSMECSISSACTLSHRRAECRNLTALEK